MFRKFTFIVALVGILALATAPAVSAARPTQSALDSIPVTGTVPGGTFTGALTITELALNEAGQLVASGTLVGSTTIGGVTTAIEQEFEDVTLGLVNAGTAACDILHLDIGPIFLDLLGLQVDLSEIVLDITAVPGPGNLLGNLLCSVAGLLDNGLSGTLQGLIDLINNLLG
jgi:hypothetical protein